MQCVCQGVCWAAATGWCHAPEQVLVLVFGTIWAAAASGGQGPVLHGLLHPSAIMVVTTQSVKDHLVCICAVALSVISCNCRVSYCLVYFLSGGGSTAHVWFRWCVVGVHA